MVAPLVQSGRDAEAHDGVVVDTLKALPDLDGEEKRKLNDLVAAMKLLAAPEAERVRKARNRTIAEERAKKTGEKVEDIMARLASRFEGRLPDEQPLVFDDAKIGTVTVGDVLDDPDKYIDQTLGDPLEPEYGRCKAKVWRGRLRGHHDPQLRARRPRFRAGQRQQGVRRAPNRLGRGRAHGGGGARQRGSPAAETAQKRGAAWNAKTWKGR